MARQFKTGIYRGASVRWQQKNKGNKEKGWASGCLKEKKNNLLYIASPHPQRRQDKQRDAGACADENKMKICM